VSAPALAVLDTRIASLAARDLPLAVSILKEAIRLPADFVDLGEITEFKVEAMDGECSA